jgi:subtilisin family serine protease
MNHRLIFGLAAALAIGACSDQQEPNTENANPGSELAVAGTQGINVVLKGPATSSQLAELGRYGTVHRQISKINAVIMSGDARGLAGIRALSFVKAANFDAERTAPPAARTALEDFSTGISTWDLDAVNVTELGKGRTIGFDGNGVYVAILDTGLLPTWREYFPTDRIADRFAIAYDGGGQDRGNISEPPNKWEDDVNSHGTHVTSTVIGYNFHGTAVNGAAPKATIIPVKVLNQAGFGWSSVIAEGIVYAADLKANGELGTSPLVINMSLGGPNLDAVEQEAIDYAVRKGVIIVAAAGNEGEDGMSFPGGYAPVISVAASGWVGEWRKCGSTEPDLSRPRTWWFACDVSDPTDPKNFYITDFSSRKKAADQDLDVAAPGSWVLGPYQVNQGQLSYFFLGGTSMASPHVAGIVALMAQQTAGLTAAQAEARLEDTAVPLAAGCRNIFDIVDLRAEDVCWGADATGAGLTTADRALGLTTVSKRRK